MTRGDVRVVALLGGSEAGEVPVGGDAVVLASFGDVVLDTHVLRLAPDSVAVLRGGTMADVTTSEEVRT